MTTLEVLQAARGLIADPEHWCRNWGLDNATCAVGAVRRTVGLRTIPKEDIYDGSKEAERATLKLAKVIGEPTGWGVVAYNDEHSHECVLAMFDAAIEQEQK